MSFYILSLTLLACIPEKAVIEDDSAQPEDSTADTNSDSGDTSPAAMPLLRVVGSFGIGDLDPSFAGYAAYPTSTGLLWAEISTGILWRCPFESVGEIKDVCAPDVQASGPWSVDKIQGSGLPESLTIADAAAGDAAEGIAYVMAESGAGVLSEIATSAVSGGYERGYTGVSLWVDADEDGRQDDLVVTAGIEGDLGWSEDAETGYYGQLAVYLDAPSGGLAWGDANFYVPACPDVDRLQWGPVHTDTDGSTLAVACPGYGYTGGRIEGWVFPLSEREADWSVTASGWYLTAKPDGGYIADSRREKALVWIQPDGAFVSREVPADGDLPGTAPVVLTTSRGRVLLATGSQARTSSGAAVNAALTARKARGALDCGASEWPWQLDGGEESFYGSLVVCDITDGWNPDMCLAAELPEDGAASCAGAIQGLIEIEEEVYAISTGWVFGSGDGCGATVWRVDH